MQLTWQVHPPAGLDAHESQHCVVDEHALPFSEQPASCPPPSGPPSGPPPPSGAPLSFVHGTHIPLPSQTPPPVEPVHGVPGAKGLVGTHADVPVAQLVLPA